MLSQMFAASYQHRLDPTDKRNNGLRNYIIAIDKCGRPTARARKKLGSKSKIRSGLPQLAQ
jgi:hypothetical protein